MADGALFGWLMLVPIGLGFVLMVRGHPQALVMPLVAVAILVMQGGRAPEILRASFAEFAGIALIFAAIAIPAQQLRRAGLFRLCGARLGSATGWIGLRFPRAHVASVVTASMFLTWLLAGLFHNITSILVMTAVLITVAEAYALPSRWLLCGALVASNLGGFSTRWGDTPNLIEARIWSLSDSAFLSEILPLNLFVVAGLAVAVTALTLRTLARSGQTLSVEEMARNHAKFIKEAGEFRLDRRLLLVGLAALAGFITIQYLDRELEIAAAAGAVLFAIAGDRLGFRLKSLGALDLDVYQILVSVFVIAHCVRDSAVGSGLESMIAAAGGAPWAIALTGYFGTALSEAASWATAAAPVAHAVNPSHAGAWALGAGICAGSSSLLTAASAGIILWSESRRFQGHEITFSSYFSFGLAASIIMLAFYIAAITLLAMVGAFGS